MQPEKVDLRFLAEACTRALESLMAEHGPELAITQDYFWAIVDPAVDDAETPPDPTIGQLTEALAFVRQQDQPQAGHEALVATRLRWLGQVLQGLATEVQASR